MEQWEELSVLIKKQKLIPFFDIAYQGRTKTWIKSSADTVLCATRARIYGGELLFQKFRTLL